MRTFLRKLGKMLRLAAVAAIVVGAVKAITGKKHQEATGEASWPPLTDEPKAPSPAPAPAAPQTLVAEAPEPAPSEEPAAEAPVAEEPAAEEPAGEEPAESDTGWVEPIEGGACPMSHPIKGNAQSNIYHVPGGLSYDRTKAERCYASPEAAEADGFRKAKR